MGAEGAFRHEALLYCGIEEFVAGTVPFIAEGVALGEPVLVVVNDQKIERLRAELSGDAGGVQFADMADVGLNPARIIPAWRRFLDNNAAGGRPVRGIGEPIWAGRSDDELVECQRHEALINYAFAGSGGWSLLCPYDTGKLNTEVVDEALCSHPHVLEAGHHRVSTSYRDDATEPFDRQLPPAPAFAKSFAFDMNSLDDARRFVGGYAVEQGLLTGRLDEVVVAAGELLTNSIRHGGGHGIVSVWHVDDTLVCEVSDAGSLSNPLAGRERPSTEAERGRGLWMVNHLCDLVQIRSSTAGTVVRMSIG